MKSENYDTVRKILIDANVDRFTIEAFLNYDLEHPEIYPAFCKFTVEAIRAGKHKGAKSIAEKIREEVKLSGNGEFKLNNDYIAYYARVFCSNFPKFKNYFEFREVRGLKRLAA